MIIGEVLVVLFLIFVAQVLWKAFAHCPKTSRRYGQCVLKTGHRLPHVNARGHAFY